MRPYFDRFPPEIVFMGFDDLTDDAMMLIIWIVGGKINLDVIAD